MIGFWRSYVGARAATQKERSSDAPTPRPVAGKAGRLALSKIKSDVQ